MNPFFTIVIPAYNREALIGRAIHSCLVQDFSDWELIVVDDGSEDGTAEVVRAFDDRRIRLLAHPVNRGRCPARNTAMAAARGEWFVFLDSDDELLPGALSGIRECAHGANGEVGAMRFMCQDDFGRISPEPPHRNETWDYEGYIRWLEAARRGPAETLPCVRAATFPACAYPDDHSEEKLYHLDIARAWNVLACSAIVRRYHYDAANRITVPVAHRSLRYAADAARNAHAVLESHGEGLRRWAPAVMQEQLRTATLWSLLAGERRTALRLAREYLRSPHATPSILPILAAGLVHRRLLAWLQELNGRVRHGRGRRTAMGSITLPE